MIRFSLMSPSPRPACGAGWSPRLSLPHAMRLALLVQSSVAQMDPVKNFCRRFGHQTTVIDRKLYIDGGLVDWNPIPSYPANYTSKRATARPREVSSCIVKLRTARHR